MPGASVRTSAESLLARPKAPTEAEPEEMAVESAEVFQFVLLATVVLPLKSAS